ncbi:uncharacterized protein LOC144065587 [Stigmatopora argus]
MPAGTKRPKFQEELFDLKGYRLEGFPQQKMTDEQLPIKKEEDHFTWSPGDSMKKEDLGVASEGAEPANASAWPQIKEEEPEFPQQQHKREEQSQIKKEQQNVTGSIGFMENLSPDGQEFVGLKEFPQIKEEEPEFPQQQMKEEQLPIQKEEDDVTWSPDEALTRQDDLAGASGGVEPKNTSWLQIKEEEPEFSEQTMIDEQFRIKNEEDYVTWSPGESVKWGDMGVASVGVEPENATTSTQMIDEEPEFPQQCKREEQPPIKNEECVKWSTGEPFKCEDDLAVANAPHTGEKPLSCTVCGKTFTHKGHLNGHARTHTGEKPFSCSVCGQAFTHKGHLNSHARTHTGEKPFSCSVCGQRFTRKGSLIDHAKIHTGEKPFSCSVCCQRFTRKGNLNSHARTHTGEKPFLCSVCGQRFTQKGSLIYHARTHTGEKPFPCSVCGRRFSYKEGLKTHIRTHTDEKPFSCSVCGKAFSQKHHLESHTRTYAGKNYIFLLSVWPNIHTEG